MRHFSASRFIFVASLAGFIGLTAVVLLATGRPSPDARPVFDGASKPLPDATAPVAAASPLHSPPVQVSSAANAGSRLEQRNLFADYQAALGSSELAVIERGLNAWHICVGYMGEGADDTESYVNLVVPEGLTHAERDRRARYARARAARCADFAMQTQAMRKVEGLSRKALDLGSASERLRWILLAPSEASAVPAALAETSCKVVAQYPQSGEGIRYITTALLDASRRRPSHMLNQTPRPARNVAINLAMCDLHPEGCGIYSNLVGSACIQDGKCDYQGEVEYLQAETTPAEFARAQELRRAIVAAVKAGSCSVLFD